MQRVGRAEISRRRQIGIDSGYSFEDFRPSREPSDRTGLLINRKLFQQRPIVCRSNCTLPKFSVKSGNRLGLAVPGTCDMIGRRKRPYGVKPGILKVKPNEVTSIKVDHETGASRSAEIVRVESIPPLNER